MIFECENYKRIGYISKCCNLSITSNKIHLIRGKNGSGKTTICKLIAGYYRKRYIDKGNIQEKRVSKIYFCDSLKLPKHLYSKELYETLRDYKIEYFDIFQIPNKKVKDLSRGNYQKLLLSIILSQDRLLYILDEPELFLDDPSKKILLDILSIYKKYGKTIIISTNNDDFYRRVTDVIWDLNV